MGRSENLIQIGGEKMSQDREVEKLINKMLKEILFQKKKETAKRMEKILVELNENEFERVLKSNPIVVIDFWAEWCMPCKFYEPIFEKVAEKLSEKVVFARVNVDENPRLASMYQIMAIPTTIIFVNGKPVEKMLGLIGEGQLERTIKKYLI